MVPLPLARPMFMTLLFVSPAHYEATTRIDAIATLDDDGRLHVSEVYDMELRGFRTFDWEVGLGADESLELKRIVRVDQDGTEHPLRPGSESQPDEYFAGVSFAHIGADFVASEVPTKRVYRIEYDLVGAVSPSWDIPAGPAPLVVFETSFKPPWRRLGDVLAQWRDAWKDPGRRYRLDHNVLFPFRDESNPSFFKKHTEVDYRLHWNDYSWRLLDPERALGKISPDEGLRVQRTLEYRGQGRPAGVDFRRPRIRLGSIAAVPLIGLLLWLLAMSVKAVLWRWGPRMDSARFASTILPVSPDVGHAVTSGEFPSFEEMLLRLANEGILSIEMVRSAGDEKPANVRLRLLRDRGELRPMDRELVEVLFPEGRTEVTSDEVSAVAKKEGLSPVESFRGIIASSIPGASGSPGKWLGWLMFIVGFFLAIRERSAASSGPLLLMGGIFGAFLAVGSPRKLRSQPPFPDGLILLVSLGAATLNLWAVHLVPNTPFDPNGSLGLAFMTLSAYVAAVVGLFARGPRERLEEQLWRAREWARRELKRTRPRLLDSWIPSLKALGLDQEMRLGEEAATQTVPDAMESDETLGPPFTGRPRPLPELGRGWAEGFDVDEA